MAVGTKVGFEGNVPLYGESEIVQKTAATDMLTLTGAASQTGDFIVCRNAAGTELLSLSSSGVLLVAGPVGAYGHAAATTAAIGGALSSVSGAFGCSDSASFVLLIAMVNTLRTACINLGIVV